MIESMLTVIAEMGAGGAESVAADLSRDQLHEGTRLRLATTGGWRTEALITEGAEVVPLRLAGRRPTDLAASVVSLRAAVRRDPPQLIHVHNVKAAGVTAAALRTLPRRRRPAVLVTLHGVPEAAYPRAARTLDGVADRLVAVSTEVAERIVAAGLSADRVEVIENAVHPVPRRDRAQARHLLGLTPRACVLLCLARLVPQKRHDLLLEALLEVPAHVQLIIAGDGPTRTAIESAVTDLGLGHRVRMLGERRDPDVLLAAADALVLPSEWEGLPISVLEALSVDVPVIASAVGALPDALAGAVQLVPPGSSTALTDGIRTVLNDPHHRAELITRGRVLLQTRFGLPRMLAGYHEAYAAVCGTAGRARDGTADRTPRTTPTTTDVDTSSEHTS